MNANSAFSANAHVGFERETRLIPLASILPWRIQL